VRGARGGGRQHHHERNVTPATPHVSLIACKQASARRGATKPWCAARHTQQRECDPPARPRCG
jgi:hypothetical protein